MAKLEITYENWKRLPVDSVDFMPQRSIYDITREFVRSIDSTITTTFTRNDFCAFISQKIINLTFDKDCFDDMFDEFIQKHFGVSINPFLMGMLHEIGHIMTYSPQLAYERVIIYELLKIDYKVERFHDFTNMYFAIPSEFEATRWGLNITYPIKNSVIIF
jgi:hypothetical protein